MYFDFDFERFFIKVIIAAVTASLVLFACGFGLGYRLGLRANTVESNKIVYSNESIE